MKKEIIGLRLNRRAIGAVVLDDDVLVFADGRHLTSRLERAIPAATKYIERLLHTSNAGAVVIDAPVPTPGSMTDQILASLRHMLAARGLTTVIVSRADVLGAFGLPALRTRDEVRALVSAYWPDLCRVRGQMQRYAADAAAAVLYGECRLAFNPPPT